MTTGGLPATVNQTQINRRHVHPGHGASDALTPQLVSDFGAHNADLLKSATRMMEPGQWKRARIVRDPAGIQHDVDQGRARTGNLIFPPNNAVSRILAVGMEWARRTRR